jgi:hyperosmotically inducible protein
VASGVVTLKGTVKTDAAKTRAEAIAKATDGVKDVKNNLRVVAK